MDGNAPNQHNPTDQSSDHTSQTAPEQALQHAATEQAATEQAASEQVASEHVAQLVWALLDDHITTEQFEQLESLLRENETARATYIECVRMHVDLYDHFAKQTEQQADQQTGQQQKPATPVLGFLNQGLPQNWDTTLPGNPTG